MNRSQEKTEHTYSDTLQCLHCKTVLSEKATFCSSCGTARILPDTAPMPTPNLAVQAKEHVDVAINDDTLQVIANTPLPEVKIRYYRPFAASWVLLTDALLVLLPLCSLILWLFSLKGVNIRSMTDLGLISVFSPLTISATALVVLSFCLSLRRPQIHVPLLMFQLGILIFMLYGVTALVEEAPRFAIVWRHAGYTEYIIRTGSVNPDLDAYFSWPGFFVLSAFVTLAAGYHDILSYAAWAPVFLNLIYLMPLYVLFSTCTTNKRLIWVAILFFYLTNWIGQDYFSPQGLNYFLYLVIVAMLLKWFSIPMNVNSSPFGQIGKRLGHSTRFLTKVYDWLTLPNIDIPSSLPIKLQQRIVLLGSLLIIFAFSVFSHPLTPFFIIASVSLLVLLRRCTPLWLPIIMTIMIVLWMIVMAQAFLAGHLALVLGTFGKVNNALSTNVTNRVHGNPEHTFIAEIRVVMTVFVWGLAFIGVVFRIRKGYRDVSPILLAIAPFPLIVTQSYGGEMLLRIYLFSLPFMVFFMASLFFSKIRVGASRSVILTTMCICMLLFGGFLFTRYGNERMDYMTNDEVAGVTYLYNIAPDHSLFIIGWDNGPLQFRDYEKYNLASLSQVDPNALTHFNVDAIMRFIQSQNNPHTYLLFTRSEVAAFDSTSGLAPGTLIHLEHSLLSSGKFKLIYNNPDTQILVPVVKTQGDVR